jgi:tetratricopeptide (TPR) repeat protein
MILTRTLAALALAAAAIAPAAAGAQKRPDRPHLSADADTADWRSYYTFGVQHISREPELAERAFYWAARLNPVGAEPLYAMFVAGWMREPHLYQQATEGDPGIVKLPATQHLFSLYERALERDPMVNQQLEKVLEDALVNDVGNNLEYSTDPLTLGLLAYEIGDYKHSLKVLHDALKQSPVRARYTRALAYDAMTQYDSAAAELSALLRVIQQSEGRNLVRSGSSAGIYAVALGNMYRKAGKPDQAREAYRTALAADLSLAAAHVALADLALVAGDAATATQEYGTAVELRPSDGGMHARFGDALRASRDNAGAVEQYRKAIELEPDYFASYLNLGIVLDRLEKRDEAAAAYTAFLARAPKAFAPQIAAVQKRLGGATGTK